MIDPTGCWAGSATGGSGGDALGLKRAQGTGVEFNEDNIDADLEARTHQRTPEEAEGLAAKENQDNVDEGGGQGNGNDGENNRNAGKSESDGAKEIDDPSKENAHTDQKKLSKSEVAKLKEKGLWDHSEKGKGGSRWDLYKDKKGNIYQKLKGGSKQGEPIDVNINDVYDFAQVAGYIRKACEFGKKGFNVGSRTMLSRGTRALRAFDFIIVTPVVNYAVYGYEEPLHIE
jgi:hypothetical protein